MKSNPKPLYLKLYHTLIEEISKLNIGDKIPSERDLCKNHDISRTTVRQAISQLESEGYVQKIQGKGTFVTVATDQKENLSDYYSFTNRTKDLNKEPRNLILDFEVLDTPPHYLLRKMHLPSTDKVIKFIRLRLANLEPMMLETTYLPYSRFESLTKGLLEQMPLYDILEEKYKVHISFVEEQFTVANLTEAQGNYLKVPPNLASFKIERLTYDKDKSVVEYTVTFARGDKFMYKTIVNRK